MWKRITINDYQEYNPANVGPILGQAGQPLIEAAHPRRTDYSLPLTWDKRVPIHTGRYMFINGPTGLEVNRPNSMTLDSVA